MAFCSPTGSCQLSKQWLVSDRPKFGKFEAGVRQFDPGTAFMANILPVLSLLLINAGIFMLPTSFANAVRRAICFAIYVPNGITAAFFLPKAASARTVKIRWKKWTYKTSSILPSSPFLWIARFHRGFWNLTFPFSDSDRITRKHARGIVTM
jgi:hypothetical protein